MVSAGLMPDAEQPTVLTGDAATAEAAAVSVEPEARFAAADLRPDRPLPVADARHGERVDMSRPRRIAVIGSGVAGLTAAHVAAKTAHVTLYEADNRLGGHADTHDVATALAIDTGFIVHNERTYPTLLRLFAELGVRDAALGDVDVGP